MTTMNLADTALERIEAEHRIIAAMMDAVERETRAFESEGAFDMDLVRLTLRYMSEYPDRFHHPKEEALFDLAGKRSDDFAAAAAMIRHDHGEMPAATDQLARMMEGLELGRNMPRDEVLGAMKRYVRRQREHMERETADVFPLLQTLLTPEDWAEAAAKMDAVEDPLHGGSDVGPFARLREVILEAA